MVPSWSCRRCREYCQKDCLVLLLAVRQLISGFLTLSHELHTNRLRKDEMKASSSSYYFSRELARANVPVTLPVQGDPDLKRPAPYPNSRFQLENRIHPCNIHPFSDGKPVLVLAVSQS